LFFDSIASSERQSPIERKINLCYIATSTQMMTTTTTMTTELANNNLLRSLELASKVPNRDIYFEASCIDWFWPGTVSISQTPFV
tara:strand:- start:464 stop:718 length:255 start_codon:yes stop_codon:yes gene_type:complete